LRPKKVQCTVKVSEAATIFPDTVKPV